MAKPEKSNAQSNERAEMKTPSTETAQTSQPPLLKIELSVCTSKPIGSEQLSGKRLRGAFGKQLLHLSCVTHRNGNCHCPASINCAYRSVFAPQPPGKPLHPSFQNGIPAYIIHAPIGLAHTIAAGTQTTLSITLLPPAQPHRQMVEKALGGALEHIGNKSRNESRNGNCPVISVLDTSTHHLTVPELHQPHSQEAISSTAKSGTDSAAETGDTITLHCITPLRLQNRGKPVFNPAHITPQLLIQALVRRHMQWCQLTHQPLPDYSPYTQAAQHTRISQNALQWQDDKRYSHRQRKSIPLGGLVGSFNLQSNNPTALQTLLPLMQIGSLLSIGKETVFGMGRYQLSQPLTPAPLPLGRGGANTQHLL